MDTICRVNDRSFRWPLETLAGLQIPRADLGVIGFTRRGERPVHLPLRVVQSTTARSPGGYQAAVVPGTELNEIFIKSGFLGKSRMLVEKCC
jgi:hypothetical protein